MYYSPPPICRFHLLLGHMSNHFFWPPYQWRYRKVLQNSLATLMVSLCSRESLVSTLVHLEDSGDCHPGSLSNNGTKPSAMRDKALL